MTLNEHFNQRWPNETWKKFSNIIKKEFNSEPLHNKKYLKSGKRINAKEDFHCNIG